MTGIPPVGTAHGACEVPLVIVRSEIFSDLVCKAVFSAALLSGPDVRTGRTCTTTGLLLGGL